MSARNVAARKTARTWMGIAALTAISLWSACDEETPPEPPATTVEAPEVIEEEPEVPEPPEEADPPSFTERQLDEMERPQLEAACYAGSQAACDRLGH